MAEPVKHCNMCGCNLRNPRPGFDLTPWLDCGGDCMTCMASVGDPDAIAAIRAWLLRAEK